MSEVERYRLATWPDGTIAAFTDVDRGIAGRDLTILPLVKAEDYDDLLAANGRLTGWLNENRAEATKAWTEVERLRDGLAAHRASVLHGPGDASDADGTLWKLLPSTAAPSPRTEATLQGQTETPENSGHTNTEAPDAR